MGNTNTSVHNYNCICFTRKTIFACQATIHRCGCKYNDVCLAPVNHECCCGNSNKCLPMQMRYI